MIFQNFGFNQNYPITSVALTSANLVLDLDAANYSALPTNGSTIAGTGAYTITTSNTNSSMIWEATNEGIFRKTTANDTDMLRFGPNYSSTSQAYTVMMVYRSVSGTAGRLLNANTASPDWLMGLWGNSGGVQDIFYNGAFIGSSSTAQNGTWRFAWMTYNGTTTTNAYAAGNTQPTGTHGTRAGNGGFNGLRLFGRFVSGVQNTEVVTADVGLVKLWDGALTLSEIQTQYGLYKTRFGY
jgi:hypothetical protein